jgi:hypothetical protein
MPRGFVVAFAVVAAIPCGWELGVTLAAMVAGPQIGVLPVLFIPVGWIAAITTAVTPWASPGARLTVMLAGTVFFFALGWVLLQ